MTRSEALGPSFDGSEDDDDLYDEEIVKLFDQEAGRLYGYLCSLGASRWDADDLVQEAFLVTRRQWPRVRDFDLPRTYLYKVASYTYWRLRKKRRRELLTADLPDAAREVGDDAFTVVEIRDTLAVLPLGQRQVLLLREFLGFTTCETGEILGIADGTVKSQLYDAKRRFAAHYGRYRGFRGGGSQ